MQLPTDSQFALLPSVAQGLPLFYNLIFTDDQQSTACKVSHFFIKKLVELCSKISLPQR
jgi:hypothetical protein